MSSNCLVNFQYSSNAFCFRDGLEEASRVLVACNHVRAIKLFIDSINSQCPYIGIESI